MSGNKIGLHFSQCHLFLLVVALIESVVVVSCVLWGNLNPMVALGVLVPLIVALIVMGYCRAKEVSIIKYFVRMLSEDRKLYEMDPKLLRRNLELKEVLGELIVTWRSKRNQLEAMLAESKIVFDTMPDIILMLNRNLEIVRTNSEAHLVFKRNLKWKHCQAISSQPEFIEAVQSVLDHQTSRALELHLNNVAKDYAIRIERFPVASSSGIAIIVVMHDITEAKRVKQLVTDFVANASHEIRTPLTGIVGLIETLRTSAKNDPQARETFLEIMAEQAKRMNDLVNELLSLSKIEMNVTSELKTDVNVLEIIQNAVLQVEGLAKDKDMEFVLQVEEQVPQIKGETMELLMIVSNLLSNAVKYGGGQTPITISVGLTSLFVPEIRQILPAESSTAIFISVEDRGEGIAAEHLPRLTERFYRVDKARSRAVGGFGLGLAIVQQALNHHRGAMRIESTLGQGSRFTVYLPIIN